MSSTAQPSSNLPPAPWKKSFLKQLSLMPSPEFVLSTLEKAPEGSPTPYVPRARFCIFRGMWAEVPPNKHYEGPKNPRVYESELPTFTSDVRMEKVGQLFGSSAGHATKDEQTKGSGGGGPVEAVFWVNVQGKDEEGEGEGKKVMTQWRIKGEAFVVDGNDIEGTETSGVRTVKSEVGKRMRVVDSGKEGEWSWKREVTNHFGNMSPGMRGSFKAPPPGQPKDQPYNDKEEKLGEKVTGLEDPVATKNFRVVIIKPDEVESTDLSDPTKSYRLRHTFNTQTGEWTTTETWP